MSVILIICNIRGRDVPFIYWKSKAGREREREKSEKGGWDQTGSLSQRMTDVIAFVTHDTPTKGKGRERKMESVMLKVNLG